MRIRFDCFKKDNVGRSRVRSRARLRIGSYNHRFYDHGVTNTHFIRIINFILDCLQFEKLIIKNNLYYQGQRVNSQEND